MEDLHFDRNKDWQRAEQQIQRKESAAFRKREVPFEFEYEFPTGTRLEAYQDEEGIGHVKLIRDGEQSWAVSDLLPEGYKLATPTYFENHPEEEYLMDYLADTWRMDPERKLILLGEMKSPRNIMDLLHEIGHAQADDDSELEELSELRKELDKIRRLPEEEQDRAYEVLLNEDMAKLVSKRERRAWAWALKTLRKLDKEYGLDISSLFPNCYELKLYVTQYLANHRRHFEWIIREGHDPDFYKDLEELFDRWKYKWS